MPRRFLPSCYGCNTRNTCPWHGGCGQSDRTCHFPLLSFFFGSPFLGLPVFKLALGLFYYNHQHDLDCVTGAQSRPCSTQNQSRDARRASKGLLQQKLGHFPTFQASYQLVPWSAAVCKILMVLLGLSSYNKNVIKLNELNWI